MTRSAWATGAVTAAAFLGLVWAASSGPANAGPAGPTWWRAALFAAAAGGLAAGVRALHDRRPPSRPSHRQS